MRHVSSGCSVDNHTSGESSSWRCVINGGVYTPPSTPTVLQFLSISDFHGNLQPVSVSGGTAGGVAAIAAHFAQQRAFYPNATLSVTAGDAWHATPPISTFFDDEPAVIAERLIGIDVDTLG